MTISEDMKILNRSMEILNNVCEACLKAKQTRISFSEKRTKPKRNVHTDVCGPVDPIA